MTMEQKFEHILPEASPLSLPDMPPSGIFPLEPCPSKCLLPLPTHIHISNLVLYSTKFSDPSTAEDLTDGWIHCLYFPRSLIHTCTSCTSWPYFLYIYILPALYPSFLSHAHTENWIIFLGGKRVCHLVYRGPRMSAPGVLSLLHFLGKQVLSCP